MKKSSEQRLICQLAWIWVHEICYVIRKHSERAKEKQAKPILWNIAADLEINDAHWQGLDRPSDALFPKNFRFPNNRLAEFYYDKLICLTLTLEIWDEGSGVHGQPREWELPCSDLQSPSLTELEKEVIRRNVAEEIVRHKERGEIPAGWLRWAEEILKPKVNWKELLKRKVRGAITVGTGQRMDYSLLKPHRRSETYKPVLLPSLQGDFNRKWCVLLTLQAQ